MVKKYNRWLLAFVSILSVTPALLLFQNFSAYKHNITQIKKWSTDKNSLLSNNILTVPEGTRLIYDGGANLTEEPIVDILKVQGHFVCDKNADRLLRARHIVVDGPQAVFECGTESVPNLKKFIVQFEPLSTPDKDGNRYGSFEVKNLGTLSLSGLPTTPWQRLSKMARAGDSVIQLTSRTNWQIGDQIVVASSSYAGNRFTELLEITGRSEVNLINGSKTSVVSQFTFTNITRPNLPADKTNKLLFDHWGDAEPENHSGHLLENRAEVMLLSRNVVIRGKETPCAHNIDIRECQRQKNLSQYNQNNFDIHLDQFNGPDLKFGPGPVSEINIANVELSRLGKMGKMGKYPIHWHHVGATNVSGNNVAKLTNSVIRDSFNRCVTIHQTHNVQLTNNVCFNHFGHGFFLEDGNETGNVFKRNIGLGSKRLLRGYSLLASDVETQDPARFAAPATFWISNPNNAFYNNVAAGSEGAYADSSGNVNVGYGTGFWFAFKDENHMPYEVDPVTMNRKLMDKAPNKVDLTKFSGNLSHSNFIGLTFDGGPNGSCFDEVPGAFSPDIQENPRNPGCISGASTREGDYTVVQTQYEPANTAIIENFTAYKTGRMGLWTISRNMIVKNSVFADNQLALTLVFNAKLENSAIIMESKKFAALSKAETVATNNSPDNTYFSGYNVSTGFKNARFSGIELYDGPFWLKNVKFINFNRNIISGDNDSLSVPVRMFVAASNRSTTNKVEGISFINDSSHVRSLPQPLRLDFFHNFGHPSKDNWAAALIDVDGSFLGDRSMAGFSIVPKEPNDSFINYPGCKTVPGFTNALACPGRMGLVFVAFMGQFDLFKTNLQDGTTNSLILPELIRLPGVALAPNAKSEFHQFSFPIQNAQSLSYRIQYRETEDLKTTPPSINGYWLGQNEVTPQIEFLQKQRHCQLLPYGPGHQIINGAGDVVALRLSGAEKMHYGFDNNYTGKIHVRCDVPTYFEFKSPSISRNGNMYTDNTGNLVLFQDGTSTETLISVAQGQSLVLEASPGPNRGIAQVQIVKQEQLTVPARFDSVASAELNLTAPSYGSQEFVLATGLNAGYYRVKITRSGRTTGSDKYIVLRKISSR